MALSLEQQTPVSQQRELLLEIEAQGTPLRIDGQKETYYVLSASQLRLLMGHLLDDAPDVDDVTGFTLEDFGLTEIDVSDYQKRQEAQHERVPLAALQPLPTDLSERLSELSGLSHDDVDVAERETLLRKLEATMLANLQASVENAN